MKFINWLREPLTEHFGCEGGWCPVTQPRWKWIVESRPFFIITLLMIVVAVAFCSCGTLPKKQKPQRRPDFTILLPEAARGAPQALNHYQGEPENVWHLE